MNNNCKICGSNSTKIFSEKILNKHIIDYFQCNDCHFIQTEHPYWLSESYSSAIASTDIGLVSRNISLQNSTAWIIKNYFDYKAKFLDYAGGYGLFVRLMRDNGFDYYRQDIYCENHFAKYFDVSEVDETIKFELVTAFEVFEHLVNPMEEISKMFAFSDSVVFSTELQPKNKMNSTDDWWYFAKETGQHVSFYTIKSLEVIATKLNCYFYSNNRNLHIFTKKELFSNPFEEREKRNKKTTFVRYLYKIVKYLENKLSEKSNSIHLDSLLEKDYEFVKKKINGN
jgi:2-polyprenyl-3-methyl-5-hydroxy-6-metoxy-1,4-benzoquinol methylase